MKPERIEELIARHGTALGGVTDAELLHLLRCARAWAELGEWLKAGTPEEERNAHMEDGRVFLYRGCPLDVSADGVGEGPDLPTATEAALRASRGEAAPRPEGEMAKAKETT